MMEPVKKSAETEHVSGTCKGIDVIPDRPFLAPNGQGEAVTSCPLAEIERLRTADAEITAALKGPMPNLQRALLVGDRKDIRAAIAKATGATS